MRSFFLQWSIPLLLWLTPAVAHAQDAGQNPLDASVPDASVGEGGAGQDNQEGDDNTGRVAVSCNQAADCDLGFTCNPQGRCVYVGVRKATGGGCSASATPVTALLVAAALLRFGLRRRLSPR